MTETSETPPVVAAVDLGSNSFHMVVAQPVHGQLRVLDRIRESVRLAAGLDENNNLSADAQEAALECLHRFGQRLRAMPAGSVRAVGTNTLRKARATRRFLAVATEALGHPIEVIAGREEARLIYLGVSHSQPAVEGQQLVMDIGGGSTEFIIGERFEPIRTESLYMGCVSLTNAWFADGAIRPHALEQAVIAARLELQPIQEEYRRTGWSTATGASGTIRAVGEVVRQAGWGDVITREALVKVRDAVLAAGHVERLRLDGLSPERATVFPGGLAVLLATFQALKIEAMRVADGALREGLLYDLLGRIQHEDVRERTVTNMFQRCGIDTAQVERVERTAALLLAQVDGVWDLQDEEASHLLHWAARLHEMGIAVAHNQYHKHGAYLLANSDLPGFSREEQERLAILVRGHRRKFPQALLKELPEGQRTRLARLCILLRLAVLLHRSRSEAELPPIALNVQKRGIVLCFPEGWLDAHPLTRADLNQESEFLRAGKFVLTFA